MGVVTKYCPFLIFLSFAFGSASPLRDDCESDFDCVPGYFCFSVTKYCSPCIDCATYNRNKKLWKGCTKNPSECDTCLPGFEEDILAGGQVRDWCIPSIVHSAAHKSNDTGHSKVHVGWPIGISFIMVAFFFAVFWKSMRTVRINRLPDAPPPYVSACSPDLQPPVLEAPLVDEAVLLNNSCSCSHTVEANCVREHRETWQQTKEDGALQQAIPFRFPYEAQSCLALLNDSDDDDSGNSDTESIAHDPPESNIDLEDESTMPSDWTPYPFPQDCVPIQEEVDCQNDISNETNNDVVDEDSEDVTEPPNKKRKEDTDEKTATVSGQ